MTARVDNKNTEEFKKQYLDPKRSDPNSKGRSGEPTATQQQLQTGPQPNGSAPSSSDQSPVQPHGSSNSFGITQPGSSIPTTTSSNPANQAPPQNPGSGGTGSWFSSFFTGSGEPKVAGSSQPPAGSSSINSVLGSMIEQGREAMEGKFARSNPLNLAAHIATNDRAAAAHARGLVDKSLAESKDRFRKGLGHQGFGDAEINDWLSKTFDTPDAKKLSGHMAKHALFQETYKGSLEARKDKGLPVGDDPLSTGSDPYDPKEHFGKGKFQDIQDKMIDFVGKADREYLTGKDGIITKLPELQKKAAAGDTAAAAKVKEAQKYKSAVLNGDRDYLRTLNGDSLLDSSGVLSGASKLKPAQMSERASAYLKNSSAVIDALAKHAGEDDKIPFNVLQAGKSEENEAETPKLQEITKNDIQDKTKAYATLPKLQRDALKDLASYKDEGADDYGLKSSYFRTKDGDLLELHKKGNGLEKGGAGAFAEKLHNFDKDGKYVYGAAGPGGVVPKFNKEERSAYRKQFAEAVKAKEKAITARDKRVKQEKIAQAKRAQEQKVSAARARTEALKQAKKNVEYSKSKGFEFFKQKDGSYAYRTSDMFKADKYGIKPNTLYYVNAKGKSMGKLSTHNKGLYDNVQSNFKGTSRRSAYGLSISESKKGGYRFYQYPKDASGKSRGYIFKTKPSYLSSSSKVNPNGKYSHGYWIATGTGPNRVIKKVTDSNLLEQLNSIDTRLG